MSGGLECLSLKQEDVVKFLVCGTHLGSRNLNFQMEQYMYKRKKDGTYIINLSKTWEKLLLAARAIVAIENPSDIVAISTRPSGQRAVLKFSKYTGVNPVAGRFTPGTFTNQIQAAFKEPRLLIITDPNADHQPVAEASYVNIPVIAFCNSDSPLKFVDIAIPCNNAGNQSIGLMWWLLAREVMRLRGSISRETPWEVMVDLFFFRDPEEQEKEEQATIEKPLDQPAVPGVGGLAGIGDAQTTGGDLWGDVDNWNDMTAPTQPPPAAGGMMQPGGQPVPATGPMPAMENWANEVPAAAPLVSPAGADMSVTNWTDQTASVGGTGGGAQNSWGGGGASDWA